MMLSRRMPRPAPSATWIPSSSGPRYTICSHIWCTRASVMLLSRVAPTTPAIPPMVLANPFELDPFEVDPRRYTFDATGIELNFSYDYVTSAIHLKRNQLYTHGY